MNLDIVTGVELINHAKEKERERQHWELYLTRYAQMDKKNYTPFSDFYNPIPKIDNSKSDEEILKECEDIERQIERQRKKG